MQNHRANFGLPRPLSHQYMVWKRKNRPKNYLQIIARNVKIGVNMCFYSRNAIFSSKLPVQYFFIFFMYYSVSTLRKKVSKLECPDFMTDSYFWSINTYSHHF